MSSAARALSLAIGLLGCAPQRTTVAMSGAETVAQVSVTDGSDALPRAGQCQTRAGWEPLPLGGQDGNECISPPTAMDAARHLHMSGDYAGAADCMVEAYEQSRREELAFNAAHLYRMAERPELARFYYERFLREAPRHARAEEARRQVEELSAPRR